MSKLIREEIANIFKEDIDYILSELAWEQGTRGRNKVTRYLVRAMSHSKEAFPKVKDTAAYKVAKVLKENPGIDLLNDLCLQIPEFSQATIRGAYKKLPFVRSLSWKEFRTKKNRKTKRVVVKGIRPEIPEGAIKILADKIKGLDQRIENVTGFVEDVKIAEHSKEALFTLDEVFAICSYVIDLRSR